MTRFRCVECGKVTTGRMPREGRHTGDGTVRFPRRHKGADGKPCPGNIREAEWVNNNSHESAYSRMDGKGLL